MTQSRHPVIGALVGAFVFGVPFPLVLMLGVAASQAHSIIIWGILALYFTLIWTVLLGVPTFGRTMTLKSLGKAWLWGNLMIVPVLVAIPWIWDRLH